MLNQLQRPQDRTLQTGLIVAILAGYTSVMLVMLMGQSRVFYTMSKDGLLLNKFSEIHSKFRTLSKPIFFHGICEPIRGFCSC
jgi:APA family basic amino acid/polyamine antiporter